MSDAADYLKETDSPLVKVDEIKELINKRIATYELLEHLNRRINLIQHNCNHEWSEVTTEWVDDNRYGFSFDAMGRPSAGNKIKLKKPRWKKTCNNCYLEKTTTQTKSLKIPNFGD